MKAVIKQAAAMLVCAVFLISCKKEKEPEPPSLSNTAWMATITITGNTSSGNIFEFTSGGSFSWHPVGATSFNGTWTQDGSTVNFIFKEYPTGGEYFWDNTGTLSNHDSIFTGTMKRRGAEGSGTFTAKKL